jgi:hypothetical protein
MTILNLFGLYTAAHIDWCVGIEHQLVKQRDIRILELEEQLAALQVPANGVPFCVDCHGPIKRGMPYHVLTIRHGDCRFVPSSVVTQSTNEGDNLTLAATGSVPKADPGFSDAVPAVEEGAEVKP